MCVRLLSLLSCRLFTVAAVAADVASAADVAAAADVGRCRVVAAAAAAVVVVVATAAVVVAVVVARVHKCVPYKGLFRDVIKDRMGDSGHEAAGAMFVIWRAASPDLSLC